MNNMKKIFSLFNYSLLFTIITLSFLISFGAYWVKNYFKNVGLSEMIYTLSQPLTGSDSTQLKSFLFGPLLKSILSSLALILLICFLNVFLKKNQRALFLLKNKLLFGIVLVFFVFFSNAIIGVHKIGASEIKNYFFEKSSIFETYYSNPKDVRLTFPEKKRNLIYIYLESMENTYASLDIGGSQPDNLIPNLSNFALNEGINFSNTDKLGGAFTSPGTGFTVGGMVAQSAGIPLRVSGSYNENEYGNTENFMPGAVSIGDILNKQGYKQLLLLGSDANFSGRSKYYSQHGNYEIRDYNYAVKNNWIPENYKVWWGYEDQKLFEFAKLSLTELSSGDQPFNFTMLTADTHFPDGFKSDQTPNIFDKQYSNVLHFSDAVLGEFINWIKEQSFYENTTIVISGDHLSMDQNFFKDIPNSYARTVYNVILNSPIEPDKEKNRKFSTMDFYPTTLASLNVKIEGDRLGLGTNLYSNKKTILETLGEKEFIDELTKRSTYYEKSIMQGSDILDNLDTGK